MQEQSTVTGGHKIQMTNRKNGIVTGVKDVVSFDNREVILETVDGMLQMRGDGFHVKRLTLEKGEIDFEGRVDSLVYSDKQNAKDTAGSVLRRLFR